ncbi:MAG: ImmA/IrrE family metallo-endopeptidase [Chloroflexi bacterium]|nr:ImmA/IrrE family metallo-endopeptidase [Chloroflexota bacterium]
MARQGQVIGAQLRKAREILQLSRKEVAEHLGISEGDILAWEAERAKPSLQLLEGLTELYGREIDYFLKETPSLPTQIQFRSVTRHSLAELSVEARKVIAIFDELCRASVELEDALGKKPPIRIRHAAKNQPPVDLAKEQRRKWGLNGKPVGNLRNLVAKEGVRIFELVVPRGEFAGFSYRHEDYGPCILLNAKDPQGRRNFTLAHEYAHLLYGDAPLVCEISRESKPGPSSDERSANLFAIEFLLPADPIREDFLTRGLSKKPSVQDVGKLAGKWNASVQAIFYRLEDLNLVEKGHADRVLPSFEPLRPRFGPPKTPAWKRRLGETYVSNAVDAYHKGHITLGKLADCLGLPLRKALEVAEKG